MSDYGMKNADDNFAYDIDDKYDIMDREDNMKCDLCGKTWWCKEGDEVDYVEGDKVVCDNCAEGRGDR